MNGPETRYGKPFDLLLLCGAQTESGRSLHDIADVAPIVAEAVLVLAETPLADAAAGVANNIFRRLEELTTEGEPTAWGSIGIVDWYFSGRETASYFAHTGAVTLLDEWCRVPAEEVVKERLEAAAHPHHIGDLDQLMRFVQEVDGRPRLGDYGKEVVRSIKTSRPRVKLLPDRLRTFEETFEGRMATALRSARTAVDEASDGYVSSIEFGSRQFTDAAGPAAGAAVAASALEHIGGLLQALGTQRESLREPLAQAESGVAAALQAVQTAAARSRFGLMRSLRRPLSTYISAAALAFRLRYAFELTEAVLASLSGARQRLREARSRYETALVCFSLVDERCRLWIHEFESREPSPVTEITQRHLFSVEELHSLYKETCGVPWGSISPAAEAGVRQSLDGLSRWIDRDESTIYNGLLAGIKPAFKVTEAMTADDFARWLVAHGKTTPELFLRDSERVAQVLCRYDRARLPDTGAFEDTSFRILGVPDRDASVFAAVGDGLLVTTGDSDRLVYVSLKLAFPASGLWHYERFQRAYVQVRRQGRVAQHIYPGLPYERVKNGRKNGKDAQPAPSPRKRRVAK